MISVNVNSKSAAAMIFASLMLFGCDESPKEPNEAPLQLTPFVPVSNKIQSGRDVYQFSPAESGFYLLSASAEEGELNLTLNKILPNSKRVFLGNSTHVAHTQNSRITHLLIYVDDETTLETSISTSSFTDYIVVINPTAFDGLNMPQAISALGCRACHSMWRTVVGPSFLDVSLRYRSGGIEERDMLVDKVKNGSIGNWSDLNGGLEVPMPPNSPRVSDKDIVSSVRFILELTHQLSP